MDFINHFPWIVCLSKGPVHSKLHPILHPQSLHAAVQTSTWVWNIDSLDAMGYLKQNCQSSALFDRNITWGHLEYSLSHLHREYAQSSGCEEANQNGRSNGGCRSLSIRDRGWSTIMSHWLHPILHGINHERQNNTPNNTASYNYLEENIRVQSHENKVQRNPDDP